jgi:hypothetical protein
MSEENKYNELVFTLAQQMAANRVLHTSLENPNVLIVDLVNAEMVVEKMAELAANILSITTDYRDEVLQEELKFRGLIPDME